MPETIQASEKNIARIFCNDYLFEIPVFQRPYAWETEQIDALLDDLIFAMRQDKDEAYFLGSVVLIKGDSPDSQVVDGQQRLTTLTMLLCVLREMADEDSTKAELDRLIRQQAELLAGRQEVVRLKLRRQDSSFFYDNVQNGGGIGSLLANAPRRETDSQRRIFENVSHLNRELNKLTACERTSLASFIIRQCYLVVVSTSDMTSAYRIFSVMNARGLNLTPPDILKAEVIGEIDDPDQQRAYADKWEDIEQELGRDRFGELFGHIRTIYAKAKQRRSLAEEFREHVLKRHEATDFVDRILDQYDDAYKSVLSLPGGIIASTRSVKDRLRHLRRLDNNDWIPPAMEFFHRYPNDLAKLEQFAKDLERLAYGLFILRTNVTDRIRRYGAVLAAIENDDAVWDEDGALQLRPQEKAGILETLNGPIYTLPRVSRPLLLRLDRLLADAGAIYEYPIISVEHVLPQNPADGSEWRKTFADEELRAYWTHRLANLVLLSHRKNTRASNLEFDRKKREYFQRDGTIPFALTSRVVNESQWTPNVLETRQKELVDQLKAEWRLD